MLFRCFLVAENLHLNTDKRGLGHLVKLPHTKFLPFFLFFSLFFMITRAQLRRQSAGNVHIQNTFIQEPNSDRRLSYWQHCFYQLSGQSLLRITKLHRSVLYKNTHLMGSKSITGMLISITKQDYTLQSQQRSPKVNYPLLCCYGTGGKIFCLHTIWLLRQRFALIFQTNP